MHVERCLLLSLLLLIVIVSLLPVVIISIIIRLLAIVVIHIAFFLLVIIARCILRVRLRCCRHPLCSHLCDGCIERPTMFGFLVPFRQPGLF